MTSAPIVPHERATLDIDVDGPAYRTPLTELPARRVGKARLRHVSLARGWYPAEGTYGYEYLRVIRGRLMTTELQRRDEHGWKTWMTDDWLHWNAMRERVLALPPTTKTLVCAGLGLGLMLHHLAAERPDIERIVVVELDADVVDLIRPTLPQDQRVRFVVGDYYEWLRDCVVAPDAILWDLAVGDRDETGETIREGIVKTASRFPATFLSVFGLRVRRRV